MVLALVSNGASPAGSCSGLRATLSGIPGGGLSAGATDMSMWIFMTTGPSTTATSTTAGAAGWLSATLAATPSPAMSVTQDSLGTRGPGTSTPGMRGTSTVFKVGSGSVMEATAGNP